MRYELNKWWRLANKTRYSRIKRGYCRCFKVLPPLHSPPITQLPLAGGPVEMPIAVCTKSPAVIVTAAPTKPEPDKKALELFTAVNAAKTINELVEVITICGFNTDM